MRVERRLFIVSQLDDPIDVTSLIDVPQSPEDSAAGRRTIDAVDVEIDAVDIETGVYLQWIWESLPPASDSTIIHESGPATWVIASDAI